MAEILPKLGHLFILTIPTIVFVFLLFFILDRLFFRPVMAVMKQREDATVGAIARAKEQAAVAEEKARKYEAAFQAARQEVYRLREAERRVNLADRESMLKSARGQAEEMVKEARSSLAAEVTRARSELESTFRSLAEEITQNILGPATLTGGTGGTES
jgi:F0F1-type ATP synthase membrane subunit b/b'